MKFLTIVLVVLCSLVYHQVAGGGATRCYSCSDRGCFHGESIETCPKNYLYDNACQSNSILIGTSFSKRKGCVDYSPRNIENCKKVNSISGGSCSLCTTDLCNNY